jgi:hypothetical protein
MPVPLWRHYPPAHQRAAPRGSIVCTPPIPRPAQGRGLPESVHSLSLGGQRALCSDLFNAARPRVLRTGWSGPLAAQCLQVRVRG